MKEHFIKLAQSKTYNFEYLPILGIEEFSKLTTELLLGENNPILKEGKVRKLIQIIISLITIIN